MSENMTSYKNNYIRNLVGEMDNPGAAQECVFVKIFPSLILVLMKAVMII
jgi:hypothetical protein